MRAAIYCRISNDPEGEGLGVERQEIDCRKLCESRGWEIVRVFVDNDISAAGSKKDRPEYNLMLESARKNEFDVLVAYSNSRLTRRPAEWVELITLANAGKMQIATVASGQQDLTTADGRAVALTIAVWDAAEAERTGERVSRAAKQRAERGIPQAGRYRLYGYDKDWNVIKDEAKVIKKAFERRAAGESVTSICKDFTEKGLKTVAGKDWRAGTLAVTLTKPIYCGLREYKGEIIGPSSVPAIIDEVLFNAVQSELLKDSKGTNARAHLGSGFLICKNCLTQMKGNAYTKNYRCSLTYGGCGKVSVRISNADKWIITMVMTRHLTTGISEPVSKTRDFDAEAAVHEKTIKALQDGFKAEIYTLREVQPQIKAERDAIRLIRQAQAKVIIPHRFAKNAKSYLDFHKMSLSQQRVFLEGYVENIVVSPSGSRHNHIFDPTRLEFHWSDGTTEVPDPNIDPDDV